MSFTRLNSDACAYTQDIGQSVGPGNYMVKTPTYFDKASVPDNSYIRTSIVSATTNLGELADISSELNGITRHASKCPTKKYLPTKNNKTQYTITNTSDQCNNFLHTEDTLISNPKCTLKERGVNRWEWLPEDPQCYALSKPYDFLRIPVHNRNLVKDNHRPCIPTPSDATNEFHQESNHPISDFDQFIQKPISTNNNTYDGVRWKTCNEIKNL